MPSKSLFVASTLAVAAAASPTFTTVTSTITSCPSNGECHFGGAILSLKPGPSCTVTISPEGLFIPVYDNDSLSFRGTSMQFTYSGEASVEITMPADSLKAIQATSDGNFVVFKGFSVPTLSLQTMGSGDISVEAIGAGMLTAQSSGSGNLNVLAVTDSSDLTASSTGSGNVYISSGMTSGTAVLQVEGSGDGTLVFPSGAKTDVKLTSLGSGDATIVNANALTGMGAGSGNTLTMNVATNSVVFVGSGSSSVLQAEPTAPFFNPNTEGYFYSYSGANAMKPKGLAIAALIIAAAIPTYA